MLRSFKKINPKGRRVSGSGDDSGASGKNTGGTRVGGTTMPNTDASRGARRHRSPNRLDR